MWVYAALIGVVLIVGIPGEDLNSVVIRLNNTLIQGVQLNAENHRPFYGFLGIPYAKPPVGPLRFMPPVPYGPLPSQLKATFEGFNCLQEQLVGTEDGAMGDEDCLVLNVYVPKINLKDKNLPVMIFIPGGAFRSMSGSTFFSGPHKFLDHDVVFVTINYRLGPLGFLSTGDEVSPGNYGLLDQLLALHWINDNIQAFGGNPHHITLFGQSAGAMSVNLHMLSPLTKGLFKNVILQSGSAYISHVVDEQPLLKAQELASKMGCPTEPSQTMIQCLRNCSAATLVSTGNLMPIKGQIKLFPRFTPVVDGYYLLDKPDVLMDQGKFHEGLSIISGLLKDEFLYFYPKVTDEVVNNSYSLKKLNRTFVTLNSVSPSDVTPFLIDPIAEEYFSNVDVGNEVAFREAAVDTMTDALFTAPIAKFIQAVANRFPTYAYVFVYRGAFSIIDFENSASDDNTSVTHGDDLVYLFDGVWSTVKFTPDEINVSNSWVDLWVNFATYNNPTPDGSPVFWDRVSNTSNIEYLEIGRNFSMKSGYRSDKVKFWNEFIPSLINETEKELNEEDITEDQRDSLTTTVSSLNVSVVDLGKSNDTVKEQQMLQMNDTHEIMPSTVKPIEPVSPKLIHKDQDAEISPPPLPGQSMDNEDDEDIPKIELKISRPAAFNKTSGNDKDRSMWHQMSNATLGKLVIGCSILALCSLLIIALAIDPLVKYFIQPDEEKEPLNPQKNDK